MEFIGYHTCSNEGGRKKVFEEAPYFSKHSHSGIKYVGSGYYFWENNLKSAHWWGKYRYNGNYYILKAKIIVGGEQLLDLVSSLEDLRFMQESINKIKKQNPTLNDKPLSFFIEFLKRAGIFSFRVIRFEDESRRREQIKITPNKILHLEKVFIICLLEKNEIL